MLREVRELISSITRALRGLWVSVVVTVMVLAGIAVVRYSAVFMGVVAFLVVAAAMCIPRLVFKKGQRAALLKGNGLVALTLGIAVTVFAAVMWLGSGFVLASGHLVIMVIAAGLLATSLLCLVASGRAQHAATVARNAQVEAVAEAARLERAVFDRRAAARADARRAVRAQELPLDEWDDAITTVPRPQPEGSVRPELRRGPRQSTQAPRSPALTPTQ